MNESMKFDKRLVERNLRKGHIASDEVEKHLASLQDREEDAVALEAELETVYGDKASGKTETEDE